MAAKTHSTAIIPCHSGCEEGQKRFRVAPPPSRRAKANLNLAEGADGRGRAVSECMPSGMTFVIFGYRRSCEQTRRARRLGARSAHTFEHTRVQIPGQPSKRGGQVCWGVLGDISANQLQTSALPCSVDEHRDLSYQAKKENVEIFPPLSPPHLYLLNAHEAHQCQSVGGGNRGLKSHLHSIPFRPSAKCQCIHRLYATGRKGPTDRNPTAAAPPPHA